MIDTQTLKQCPFCGSIDLLDGDWYIDDEQVDAVECNRCKAGAPVSVWNTRSASMTHDTERVER